MYVILDTNVIIKDYHFKSKAFKTLFDYLNKTPHRLIIPRIVIEELKFRYKEDIILLKSDINKKEKELKNILDNDYSGCILSLEDELDKYSIFLDLFIKEKKILITDYNDEHYKKIIERSISKKPPFIVSKDHSDYGFKDAVIWESVKDIIKNEKYEFVAFVSKNTCQFADSTKEKFNESLLQEIKENEGKFTYLPNLESFLEKYCEKISKLSIDKLQEALNEVILVEKFSFEYFESIFGKELLSDADDIVMDDVEIYNFYVFKADKNFFYVQSIGLAKIYIIHIDDITGEVSADCLYANFNASFKISKKDYKICLTSFDLEKKEIIGS